MKQQVMPPDTFIAKHIIFHQTVYQTWIFIKMLFIGVLNDHPQFSVTRLQTIFDRMHKKRPQSVKLKSSQSDTDRPRNNLGKGCHQTDT